jgi:hypothetical protein
MTTQDKAMLWAVVATIGLFAFFWQWTHAEADAKRLARSLYDVCETLRYAYPEIMTDRDWPSPPADETEEFQRYLRSFSATSRLTSASKSTAMEMQMPSASMTQRKRR